jgi:hypothetical protein
MTDTNWLFCVLVLEGCNTERWLSLFWGQSRSNTDFVLILNGGPIPWKSRRCVAISAHYNLVCRVIAMQTLHPNNPARRKHSRHIHIPRHYIRELCNYTSVEWCSPVDSLLHAQSCLTRWQRVWQFGTTCVSAVGQIGSTCASTGRQGSVPWHRCHVIPRFMSVYCVLFPAANNLRTGCSMV